MFIRIFIHLMSLWMISWECIWSSAKQSCQAISQSYFSAKYFPFSFYYIIILNKSPFSAYSITMYKCLFFYLIFICVCSEFNYVYLLFNCASFSFLINGYCWYWSFSSSCYPSFYTVFIGEVLSKLIFSSSINESIILMIFGWVIVFIILASLRQSRFLSLDSPS